MEYFMGLIFGCPNKEEKAECPFKNLRKTPKNLAVKLWESLSMNEKRKLIYKHMKCVNFM